MATSPQSTGSLKRRAKRRPKLLVLHGPSGGSEAAGPDIIATIDSRFTMEAARDAIDLITFRGDGEDALVERIRIAATEGIRFIVVDPAGLPLTSPSLRDALSAAMVPFIAVHLANGIGHEATNPLALSAQGATAGVIAGFGVKGYELALIYALRHVQDR